VEVRLLPLRRHQKKLCTPCPTQLDIFLILCNYACLYVFRANFAYWVIGELIAGFYSAFVLIGNHEKEMRFA
jgi:hypothetical protein